MRGESKLVVRGVEWKDAEEWYGDFALVTLGDVQLAVFDASKGGEPYRMSDKAAVAIGAIIQTYRPVP